MEEYEKFCENSLARIQDASLSTESFLPVQSESISLIRFHGVAVLSPLLNIEKRKEMQQEKQKALDVETRKHVNRKKALLTRVQEILENVQVRKAPKASDFDPWETETVYSDSEVRNLNVPATFPNILPSPTEHSTLGKFEKITGILPLNNEDQFKSNGVDLTRDSEFNSLKHCDSSDIISSVENETSVKTPSTTPQETLTPNGLFPTNEEQDPSLSEEVTPDPYIMSLQNLMKKSKEYIEREQSRRSLRSSVKRSVYESHSDKENEAVKGTDSGREKVQLAGRHCASLVPDKPSLNKSNVLLQGASTQASGVNMSVLGSFSKVDIPVRTGHCTVLDLDSDFKVIPTFVPENHVIKSLTGSYAKLPSPEPSLSPKMHRRHSRPSSACHILINNPVNACELSPKGKEQTVDLVVQATDEETNIPESVPKLPADLAGVCSSKVCVTKNTSEAIQEVVLGKSNQVCQSSGSQLEKKVIHGLAIVEGQLTSDGRGPLKMDSTCTAMPRLPEPYATSQCIVTQNFGTMSGLKSANVLEKNTCNLQMELNKSYDVKNPSPLLMQNQNTRQQMDTPTVSCGNEPFLDNSFEKVKRRLDLDIDSLQKENCPYVLTTGVAEQERQYLPEKRYPKGSVYINKNKMLESSSKEGEEILKSKMLAFEEMRKRLEEQHAQQLSLLIAEQEREQERLQKEIEEQEKMLKEKKVIAAEASESGINNAVDLEWRKISDSGLLETMLSQVDSLHTSNSNSSGFTNSALQHSFASANEAPFYLWGSSTSGLNKLSVTRPFGRAKPKWSQVFSPEVQTKFNKITAVAKGFLTRRLMQTDKLKQLRQTVKDTMEFIRSFQSEAPLKRGVVSAQDASLQERVLAQLRAALYGIHDIFFVMDAAERMSILHHDREVRKEKMLRQMDKMKSPRVALSAATQKSLDRKKYMKAAEMGMPNKKFLVKQNPSETRVLQPNQGQNAPVHRLLSRQGHSRSRNYKAEFASCRLEAVPLEFGDYHPLKPITVTESKTKKVSRKGSTSSTSSSSSSSVVDPLSSVLDGTDPLSMFAATAEPAATDSSRKRRDRDENSIVGSDFEPWASKRGEILARYTTTEKLSINLFMGSEKGKAGTATSAMSEKVRTRLEELDDFEEGSQKELLNLTQQDYVNRIEELNQSLKDAWASDQKVKALKIVIQCSKLLSDTSVIQFYPSKFVLITDILDTFGKLVYERIFSMCVDNRSVLPDHFSPENVNDTAKETCLNWFFKIASIRELIPRFYVEASILKCNKFLSKMGISECLPRLTCMIRGIGDPLVSVYARAYLCRVGMEVAPHLKESLNKNFFDFLLTFKQIHGDTVQNQLVVQGVELPSYLPLYSPAMDWIFQCISYHAPEALLTEMMERCKKLGNNALLLNSVMSAFRAEFIATRSMDFIGMIKECDESGFPKHLLFRSLGLNLALADPPEGDRLQILNEAWKVITKLKNPQDYINCAEVWVEYTCKHFTKREVNTVLADVIKHMTPDRAFEDSYPQLQSIIKKVIAHFHDFSVLFSVEKFLPFLDMFQKESVRVEVCKCIMEVFIKHQQEPTKDPVILNALLHVCKTMHDSVNALTLEDEKRMLAYLINGFIKMVSFGRDFEQQLSFYVEARSMFCNLEPVLVQLIHSVNRLAMETRKVMKGNHSRKTAAFVRACVAYCFITIPSLVSIFTRLNLYLHSGQVALANQCLSQADAFFKAAISLIPEVPKMINIDGKMRPSESFLLEFLCNFFSTLLIVPDHPEHGVLFLVRELLNVIQDYTWEDNGDDKIRIYTCVLHLLSAMSQETYLYHIDKVDSNDSLYGGDSKFLAENNKLCETVMAQILEHLKTLAKDEALKRQSSLGLSFFNSILAHGDLRNNRLNQLSVNLWHLAQRHGCADTRTMVKTLEYIKRRSKQPDMGHLTELALRLPLQTRT